MVKLKLAGIFGIVLLLLTVASIVISITMVSSSFNIFASGGGFKDVGDMYNKVVKIIMIFSLVSSIASIIFLLGFVTLGKMFDNKLLVVTAWIFIIFAALAFIVTSITVISGNFDLFQGTTENTGVLGSVESKIRSVPVFNALFSVLGPGLVLIFLIILALGAIAAKVCFGIGLIQVGKKKARLAEWAGAFEIGSLVLGILGTIAILFETIVFFRLAKEQESPGQTTIPHQI